MVQWVKVDVNVIHQYYQLIRGIVSLAVQDEVVNLGGIHRTVQIGVISLGTTSGEGQKREVKVEVLGVLDVDSGKMRLRATEPATGVSQAERFARIFEPLPIWVHKSSRIITDFSVDKDRLLKLGYNYVNQVPNNNNRRPETTNHTVMEYLKKVVPKMFQVSKDNFFNFFFLIIILNLIKSMMDTFI